MRSTLAVLCPFVMLAACTTPGTKVEPMAPYWASGVEPFWSAQIDGGRLLIDQAGEPRLTRSIASPAATANGRRYVGAGVTLNVLNQPCENTMSGAAFAETVTVE